MKTTDFGFEQIPVDQKTEKVKAVFDQVSDHYDLMNDLMSLGLHRLWKKYVTSTIRLKPYSRILDLACGTGDMAEGFIKKLEKQGMMDTAFITLADYNFNMLKTGRDKCIDHNYYYKWASSLAYAQVDAENLPFENNSFDIISMAFGLRNVTDKTSALASIYQTLKPGGCLYILEFSKPASSFIRFMYEGYSLNCIPRLGRYVAHAEDSYRYLVESIRRHPDQETLKKIIESAGFERCVYINLTGGIVCLHKAYKT